MCYVFFSFLLLLLIATTSFFFTWISYGLMSLCCCYFSFSASLVRACSYQFYCPFAWTLIYYMLFYALFCALLRLLAIVYQRFFFLDVKSACAHPQRCHTSMWKHHRRSFERRTQIAYTPIRRLRIFHFFFRFVHAPRNPQRVKDAKRQNNVRFYSTDSELCD